MGLATAVVVLLVVALGSVGVTAVLGGSYLLWLMHRRTSGTGGVV